MYRKGDHVEIQTSPNAWQAATVVTNFGGSILVRTPDGKVYADPHPDKIRTAGGHVVRS